MAIREHRLRGFVTSEGEPRLINPPATPEGFEPSTPCGAAIDKVQSPTLFESGYDWPSGVAFYRSATESMRSVVRNPSPEQPLPPAPSPKRRGGAPRAGLPAIARVFRTTLRQGDWHAVTPVSVSHEVSRGEGLRGHSLRQAPRGDSNPRPRLGNRLSPIVNPVRVRGDWPVRALPLSYGVHHCDAVGIPGDSAAASHHQDARPGEMFARNRLPGMNFPCESPGDSARAGFTRSSRCLNYLRPVSPVARLTAARLGKLGEILLVDWRAGGDNDPSRPTADRPPTGKAT